MDTDGRGRTAAVPAGIRTRTLLVLALVGAGLVLVLLALTARTAGEAPISGGPDLGNPPPTQAQSQPSAPTAPPERPLLPTAEPGPQHPALRTLVEVLVALAVLAGVGLVALVVVLVVRALGSRPDPEGIDDADGEVVVNLVAVQQHLDHSTSEIDVEGDVNQAIVRCWQGLEHLATSAGATRDPAQTAREFTLSVLDRAALPAAPLARLANLYEAALFSGGQLPERTRAEALACLTDLRGALAEAVPANGSATGAPADAGPTAGDR